MLLALALAESPASARPVSSDEFELPTEDFERGVAKKVPTPSRSKASEASLRSFDQSNSVSTRYRLFPSEQPMASASIGASRVWVGSRAKRAVLASLEYGALTPLANHRLPATGRRPLHSIDAEIALIQGFGPKWAALASVSLGYHSDFRALGLHAFQPGGAAYIQHEVGETSTLGFGLYVASIGGRPLLLPLLELAWRPSPALVLNVLLPQHIKLTFEASPRFWVSLAAHYEESSYAISEIEVAVPTSQAANANGLMDANTISHGLLSSGISARLALSSRWVLSLASSIILANSWTLAERYAGGTSNTYKLSGPKGSWVLDLSLGVRL